MSIKTVATKDIRRVLEWPAWPEGLEARKRYARLHDDHDGTGEGRITVVMGEDGDAWVDVQGKRPCESLRFRTMMGGGGSIRTRNALMLLAYAIKLDEEEGRPA